MFDDTEEARRMMVAQINRAVESDDVETERARLVAIHGQGNVFDTEQTRKQFEILSFMAPFVVVRRKSDNKRGVMEFQHTPRFYFAFDES